MKWIQSKFDRQGIYDLHNDDGSPFYPRHSEEYNDSPNTWGYMVTLYPCRRVDQQEFMTGTVWIPNETNIKITPEEYEYILHHPDEFWMEHIL